MTRSFAAASAVALIALPAAAKPRPVWTPATVADTRIERPPLSLPYLPTADFGADGLEQYGEIVILEGDADTVTDDGSGGVGIVFDQSRQNPPAITTKVLAAYGDLFDEVIVYTTFKDDGTPGALAYELGVQSDVDGLGQMRFDDSASWGSQGALHAFVNMKYLGQYQILDGLAVTDPSSTNYPVLGQEFAHRWLAYMSYTDGNGAVSQAMLGRQMAHWASTLDADASVMDGQRWVDNGDGTFTDVEATARYSPLDLYGMGLVDKDQVLPWFRIANAVDVRTGQAVDPTLIGAVGSVYQGTREDITIDQVISANGARNPPFGGAPRSFRVAIVLVTRPGERAGDVVSLAAQLEQVRTIWEKKFATYTGGNGTVCTQVSAPCGSPVARVIGGTIREGAGANGNGVVEPGEPIDVDFKLTNDGSGAATDVQVTASAPSVSFPQPAAIPQLHAGDTVDAVVSGTVAGDGSLCGEILTVEGQAQSGGHTWHGFAQTVVGLGDAYLQRFDAGAGYWGVDLDETDTAFDDSWQWGVPQQYLYSGFYTLQPNGGNDGACWFTGLAAGNFRTGDYHGLGMGRATLRSPPIDLSSAISPSVRYQAWFIALDVSDPLAPPVVADEDHLILEATNDGIAWAKVDQVDGEDDRWRPRNVPLTGVRLDQPVQFRFTVNRGDPDHPAPDELVEAGVDDFEVVTDLPSCVGRPDTPDMGTQAVTPFPGCTIGRGQGMGMGWPLLVFFGIVIFRGASRRPRSPACRPSREGSGGAFPRR